MRSLRRRKLGSIAHDAGHNGKGVDHRVDGSLIAVAAQVHDACACTRTRADRAAVGRQGADAGLFVDGHQIGDDEGAVELFLAAVQLLGVLDEGHRAGDA